MVPRSNVVQAVGPAALNTTVANWKATDALKKAPLAFGGNDIDHNLCARGQGQRCWKRRRERDAGSEGNSPAKNKLRRLSWERKPRKAKLLLLELDGFIFPHFIYNIFGLFHARVCGCSVRDSDLVSEVHACGSKHLVVIADENFSGTNPKTTRMAVNEKHFSSNLN
ncbi:hypothetical protein C8R43DRAFT_956162 [Mycena crocata]|nr:hypothetical protein C8R43DRAFT_956162 [Mycena crocata]